MRHIVTELRNAMFLFFYEELGLYLASTMEPTELTKSIALNTYHVPIIHMQISIYLNHNIKQWKFDVDGHQSKDVGNLSGLLVRVKVKVGGEKDAGQLGLQVHAVHWLHV